MPYRRMIAAALLSGAALPAYAADFPFEGSWKITNVSIAPWEDPAHPMEADDADRHAGKIVTIGKDDLTGPDLLGCGKTEMKVEPLPYAGLFEGGLAADPRDPAAPYDKAKARKLALELGFAAEPVASLFQGCSEIILHKRDDRTLLFGMNNRIFTLEKQ